MNRANELIELHWTGDADSTAKAILDALGLVGDIADTLFEPVRNYVRDHARSDVRRIERNVHVVDTTRDGTDGRNALLVAHFYNGDRYVTWGEATVEDHEKRITYLRKQIAGLNETVLQHELAIAQIQAHRRARCLNDIKVKAA